MLKTLQRLINAIVWTPRILFVWLLLCFLNEEPDAGARRREVEGSEVPRHDGTLMHVTLEVRNAVVDVVVDEDLRP